MWSFIHLSPAPSLERFSYYPIDRHLAPPYTASMVSRSIIGIFLILLIMGCGCFVVQLLNTDANLDSFTKFVCLFGLGALDIGLIVLIVKFVILGQ
jgi:hypothetical protein